MKEKLFGLSYLEHKGLRGGLIFLSILIAGCYFVDTNSFKDYWMQQYISIIVKIGTHILNFLGISVQANGNIMFMQGINLSVDPACIALYEIFVFAAAIISYPLKMIDKFIGVAFGVVGIWIFNLLRIIVLFFAAIYFPNIFKVLHDHVIQAIFILFMVVLWCTWVNKSIQKKNDV